MVEMKTHAGEDTIVKALTIAGSDSGGGAGIQADLKTFGALGVHGCSVVTAVTAQNTKEVSGVHEIPIEMIENQLDAVLSDIGCDVVKVGMLSSKEIILCVARVLRKYADIPVVVDPVMVAASGARLIHEDAISALTTELFPIATLVTPNSQEAEVLISDEVKSVFGMKHAAEKIMELGCDSVLVKGGHVSFDGALVTDVFYDGDAFKLFENSHIDKEGHGTGCTLSSAIAAYLARGYILEEAVREGIAYVHGALVHGYSVGSRNVVLDHFWK